MAGQETSDLPHPAMNPLRLQLVDAARVLSTTSGQVITAELLEQDVVLGAPTNQDVALSLLRFVVWALKELARGRSNDRPLR